MESCGTQATESQPRRVDDTITYHNHSARVGLRFFCYDNRISLLQWRDEGLPCVRRSSEFRTQQLNAWNRLAKTSVREIATVPRHWPVAGYNSSKGASSAATRPPGFAVAWLCGHVRISAQPLPPHLGPRSLRTVTIPRGYHGKD